MRSSYCAESPHHSNIIIDERKSEVLLEQNLFMIMITCLKYLLRGDLGAEKSAFQVYQEHFFVLRFGRIENGGARLNSRVVDHDVDAAEFFAPPCLRAFANRPLCSHVGIDANCLTAEVRYRFL